MLKNQKISKKLVLGCLLVVGILLLAGCNTEKTWYADYSLKTDKITIWVNYEPTPFKSFDITDSKEIKAITDAVDFSSWVRPEGGIGYDGLNYYCLDFHNGTVIGMYRGEAYGNAGRVNDYSEKIYNTTRFPFYDCDEYTKPYYFPEKFLNVVKELEAKYMQQ